MWIAGLHHGHDASTCLLKNGEIVFYSEEERYSRKRHDTKGQNVFNQIKTYTKELDHLCLWENNLSNSKWKLPNFNTNLNIKNFSFFPDHHLFHASVAFYNSGFDKAVCVVVDGRGQVYSEEQQERETIFLAEYPARFEPVWRNFDDNPICDITKFGQLYKRSMMGTGFVRKEHGKFMGLTSYSNKRLPFTNLKTDIIDKIPKYKEDFQLSADYANTIQEYLQEQLLEIIKYAVEKTGCKNVVLSGGFIQNVRANYYYRKNLPKDVLLYCEPLCYDGGLSMGLAKYAHHKLTGDSTIRKQETLYYGQDYSNQN